MSFVIGLGIRNCRQEIALGFSKQQIWPVERRCDEILQDLTEFAGDVPKTQFLKIWCICRSTISQFRSAKNAQPHRGTNRMHFVETSRQCILSCWRCDGNASSFHLYAGDDVIDWIIATRDCGRLHSAHTVQPIHGYSPSPSLANFLQLMIARKLLKRYLSHFQWNNGVHCLNLRCILHHLQCSSCEFTNLTFCGRAWLPTIFTLFSKWRNDEESTRKYWIIILISCLSASRDRDHKFSYSAAAASKWKYEIYNLTIMIESIIDEWMGTLMAFDGWPIYGIFNGRIHFLLWHIRKPLVAVIYSIEMEWIVSFCSSFDRRSTA